MTDFFSKITFILVEPSHPGNIGASARALKNMGFSKLTIVNPKNKQIKTNDDAIKFASNAQDILEQTFICEEIHQALNSINFSIALTARSERRTNQESYDIKQAVKIAISQILESNKEIAFVLGSEKYGLSNKQISTCNCICSIPTNDIYQSLNISHALQILAWELRCAINNSIEIYTDPKSCSNKNEEDFASTREVLYLIEKLEKVLINIKFLDPSKPKKLILKLTQLLLRNNLRKSEVNILHGICKSIVNLKKQ